jgi:hypothetical protein
LDWSKINEKEKRTSQKGKRNVKRTNKNIKRYSPGIKTKKENRVLGVAVPQDLEVEVRIKNGRCPRCLGMLHEVLDKTKDQEKILKCFICELIISEVVLPNEKK